MLGGVAACEGQVDQLGGGEHPMLVQQPAQGPVAVRQPPGQGGQPLGGAAPTAPRAHHRRPPVWSGWPGLLGRSGGGGPAGGTGPPWEAGPGGGTGTPVGVPPGPPAAALTGSFAWVG